MLPLPFKAVYSSLESSEARWIITLRTTLVLVKQFLMSVTVVVQSWVLGFGVLGGESERWKEKERESERGKEMERERD